jgi:hypothetical protein
MKIEQNEGTSHIDHDHDFSWDYIFVVKEDRSPYVPI